MADHVTVKSQSTEPAPPSASGNTGSLGTPQLIVLCSAGLLICFFLPWTSLLGQGISGFDLQKMGGHNKLLWLIPISSAVTMFSAVRGKEVAIAAYTSSSLPFVALAYWLHLFGTDVFKIMNFGAWLSLGLAIALSVLARRVK